MKNSGDIAWIMVSSALVMLMTMPGLALFYGGLVRRKNVLSTIMFSFFALCLISIQWVLYGYSLSFSNGPGYFIGGLTWFGFQGVGLEANKDYAETIPHMLFAIFQMMFAVITPALISGAFAERMKFSAYALFIVLWSTLVYDPLAHWVWAAEGWLKHLGMLDFAGGTVVHISSGISALLCALFIGKRRGYGREPMPPHNLTLSLLGAGLVWFGWFGFNAGSALAASDIAVIAFLNTNTAAAAAGLMWMIIEWINNGKPTILGGATGVIAGLVAITPACGYVGPLSSIWIGFASSVACYYAVVVIKQKFDYDDSIDAFGIHCIGGITGALMTGLFANKLFNPAGNSGLIYGNPSLLGIQILGVLVTLLYTACMTWILLKITDALLGLRVSENDELMGLDITQHEESAYTLLD